MTRKPAAIQPDKDKDDGVGACHDEAANEGGLHSTQGRAAQDFFALFQTPPAFLHAGGLLTLEWEMLIAAPAFESFLSGS